MPVCTLLSIAALVMTMPNDPPTVEVTQDDTVITESCRIVIPAGTVIEDVHNDGVIQIDASGIEIDFGEGSELRGAAPGTRPDEYHGYGIRLNGHHNVLICGARVSGYWCGIWATSADGLTIEDVDASDNRRAHLKSTPVAEDGSDWLFPHSNDNNEWLNNYAAAIYVEDSREVTIRDCRVWHGQNGLCLDRVDDSKIYDNDFSFNSGWGIAMWRSSRNVISRNAIDFCVRGYSHGVYNRGQDSAGILMFEQNNDNVIAESSATHGGDCFFGFAGREAIAEVGRHPLEWYRRRGNDNNLLINNDFSYAPAHGIEMTFSFGNKFIGNRMVENAICGVWGGYSQDTLIAGNHFERNGDMGYGLERGGVDIEHGQNNRIVHNTFKDNKCGVHLWWDPEGDFGERPWGRVNGTQSKGNLIVANEFAGDQLVFHFRGPSDVTIGPNTIRDVGEEMEADAESTVIRKPDMTVEPFEAPDYPVYGQRRPVGARPQLRGRHNIIMTEWGPWDHASPLIRKVEDTGDSVTYELHELPDRPDVEVKGSMVKGKMMPPLHPGEPPRYVVTAAGPGVYPYCLVVSAGDFTTEVKGTLLVATWDATFFEWPPDLSFFPPPNTPPERQPSAEQLRAGLSRWRALATEPAAVQAQLKQLTLKYGGGGPSDLNISDKVTAAQLGGNHFGMIAKTKLLLPAGKWEFATTSDDGVRVTVDGKPVIDNWTWHPPHRDTGVLELPADTTVEVVVEHFEIDGYATLELEISRAE
jgi:parallel beta-helix repeat protein